MLATPRLRHCQLETATGTVAGCSTMSRVIHATGSHRRSSATPFGSTTGSRSASATSKTPRATRHHRLIRNRPALVSDLRPRLRATAPPSPRAVGDTWHLDELFVTINGRRQYLWRAVDQDGDVIDILLQPRRDRQD